MENSRVIKVALILVLLSASLLPCSAALADSFDILDKRETMLSGGAVDLVVSGDGRWTFILTGTGEVAIYDTAGRLLQTLKVGSGYDRIAYDQTGNRLLLGGSGRQEMRVITLAMRYGIDDNGSPIKGAKDAPVTVATFNDFQ
jgi:hypothetical protein